MILGKASLRSLIQLLEWKADHKYGSLKLILRLRYKPDIRIPPVQHEQTLLALVQERRRDELDVIGASGESRTVPLAARVCCHEARLARASVAAPPRAERVSLRV